MTLAEEMDELNAEGELKKLAVTLNEDIIKQMNKCMQELTTTGLPALPEADIKKFKRFCRESDDYVRYAFYLIMKQLKKNHSEIRLSAFQVADELFNRSHAFREMLVLHLQMFLALTTAIELKKPLPPPVAAANRLKSETLLAIQRWFEKFGKGYRKLAHGYDYLKNSKFVDFANLQAQNEAERLRQENEQKRKQKIMDDRISKVLKEISETRQDIVDCATEAENCLKLLLPTTSEDFLMDFTVQPEEHLNVNPSESSESRSNQKVEPRAALDSHLSGEITYCNRATDRTPPKNLGDQDVSLDSVAESDGDVSDVDDSDGDELNAHGLNNSKFTLCIEVPERVCVQETTDNTDVMRSLKDSSKLIDNSYLPKVIRWLEILSKNGGKESVIKAAIDLKVHLETIKSKCVELKLVSLETKKLDEDDSDDDFEEVPEKEGYEPNIPNHLRKEYGLAGGSVKDDKSQCKLSKVKIEFSSKTSISTSASWSLKGRLTDQNAADPTSMAHAIAQIKPESIEKPSSSRTNQEATTSSVPFVEFGEDLAYWENPDQIEVPTVIKFDSLHRFWAPKEAETEKPSQHELSALKNRVFTFPGKFEPVKWKCRAPMANGKLCERMDRVKCPFHGKIIARDESGKPSGSSEVAEGNKLTSMHMSVKEEEPSTSTELPPWQDPELQREIEHATGHDLGSARSQKLIDKVTRKGKGKGKKSKKSSLTDLKALNNSVHKRLEDKVFNKRSLKRVCATLDKCDYRRIRDKFGSQFHYSLG